MKGGKEKENNFLGNNLNMAAWQRKVLRNPQKASKKANHQKTFPPFSTNKFLTTQKVYEK